MNAPARILALAALAGAAAASGGCVVAAVAVGAAAAYGVVSYTENEAYRDFDKPLDATWTATIAALRENGYVVSDAMTHGPMDGRIQLGDVDVRVERETGDFTRVHVRVGTFTTDDHRRKAGLILESTATRLE